MGTDVMKGVIKIVKSEGFLRHARVKGVETGVTHNDQQSFRLFIFEITDVNKTNGRSDLQRGSKVTVNITYTHTPHFTVKNGTQDLWVLDRTVHPKPFHPTFGIRPPYNENRSEHHLLSYGVYTITFIVFLIYSLLNYSVPFHHLRLRSLSLCCLS